MDKNRPAAAKTEEVETAPYLICVLSGGRTFIGEPDTTADLIPGVGGALAQKDSYVALQNAFEVLVQRTASPQGMGVSLIPSPIAPFKGLATITLRADGVSDVTHEEDAQVLWEKMQTLTGRRPGGLVVPALSMPPNFK